MNKTLGDDVTRDDFVRALKDLDSYIDVTVEDLMRIHELAHKHAHMREVKRLLVRELMTPDVVTVPPDMSLRDAAKVLLERRISGMPVVERSGALVGIITEADFLAALGIPSHHAAHNVWQALEALFQHRPRMNGLDGSVADIMVREVVTVAEDQTLDDVIQRMKRHRIKRLVVTGDASGVRGIITRSNLVRVFLEFAQ